MSDDDATKPGSVPGNGLPGDRIVAAAGNSMAALFASAIGAMAGDVERTLRANFRQDSSIEQAVADITRQMITLLATQVSATLPAAPPSWPRPAGGGAKPPPPGPEPEKPRRTAKRARPR